MKRIILFLTAILTGIALSAQPTGGVKGIVINRNGRQPVENAKLTLMQGAAQVATATSGED